MRFNEEDDNDPDILHFPMKELREILRDVEEAEGADEKLILTKKAYEYAIATLANADRVTLKLLSNFACSFVDNRNDIVDYVMANMQNINSLNDHLHEANVEIAKLSNNVGEEFQDIRDELDQERQTRRDNVAYLEQRIDEDLEPLLEANIPELGETLQSLQNSMNDLLERVGAVEHQYQDVDDRLNKLETQGCGSNGELARKIKVLEDKVNNTSDDISLQIADAREEIEKKFREELDFAKNNSSEEVVKVKTTLDNSIKTVKNDLEDKIKKAKDYLALQISLVKGNFNRLLNHQTRITQSLREALKALKSKIERVEEKLIKKINVVRKQLSDQMLSTERNLSGKIDKVRKPIWKMEKKIDAIESLILRFIEAFGPDFKHISDEYRRELPELLNEGNSSFSEGESKAKDEVLERDDLNEEKDEKERPSTQKIPRPRLGALKEARYESNYQFGNKSSDGDLDENIYPAILNKQYPHKKSQSSKTVNSFLAFEGERKAKPTGKKQVKPALPPLTKIEGKGRKHSLNSQGDGVKGSLNWTLK